MIGETKMSHTCVTAAFALASILIVPAAAHAQDAVAFQINRQHSGAALFPQGLKLPLSQIWTRNLGGLTDYPLIAEGKVFVSAAQNDGGAYGTNLFALDAATGATVWEKPIPGTYYQSLAAYDNGTIYVINYDGVLSALKASTGKQLWQIQVPTQSSFASPPTASNGFIYINGAGSGGTLFALREADGSVAWSASTQGGLWSAPTLSEDGVFVSYACVDYEFDAVTGAPRWQATGGCSRAGGGTAALYDQLLFTSGLLNDAHGSGQLAYSGKVELHLPNLSDTYAYQRGVGFSYPPALQAGIGYYVTANGLDAISVPANQKLWHFAGDKNLSPAAIVVNGTVMVASALGNFYVLDGQTGTLQQQITLPAGTQAPEGGVPNALAAGDGIIAVPYEQSVTVFTGASNQPARK
jgi:outer membrane protein assembly factor BamB